MITIILADDHKLFLQGLAAMLRSTGKVLVAGQAEDGTQALKLIFAKRPQVAVLDMSMPGKDGLDVAAEVRACGLETAIVLLTMYKEGLMLDWGRAAGVAGFVLKDDAFSDVMLAIEAAAAGKTFVSPALANEMPVREAQRTAILTPREKEILVYIARDFSNKEIAARLFISPRTVDTHRTQLMRKLDLHTTAAIVAFASRAGLLPPKKPPAAAPKPTGRPRTEH